ncbi:MAG: TIGR00725 family protein [Candidatus Zixiibacteriota bacterium]|nr:MAG: TIGR00725 family protein [candidate division Zixibacteria bacterium]
MNKIIIGVIGGSAGNEKVRKTAYEVGKLIAEAGALLVCGGLSGVMEAACKGAREAGGTTIGILKGRSIEDANPYVDIPVATGLGHGRNLVIINTARALIAISGRYGTLSEIAFAIQSGKPVFGLGTWDIEGVIKCDSPEEAVKKALEASRNLQI